MAQVRNITTDTLFVEHLGRSVAPGEVIDVPDADVLPIGGDHDEDYSAANPNARNWRVPGTWEVVGDPPAVTPKPTTPEPAPAPADAPTE